MTTNGYTPETARTAYFPGSTNALARLWAREKTLHDWDDMGAVTFFEGPGDNPTTLPGYSLSKLWLRTTAGVTTTSGTIRFYTGGDATLLASWPELTKAGFASHLGARGGSLDFVWSAATSGDPGAGYVLANNATLASATAINISKTGRGGQSYGSLMATWDDSTTADNKGTLILWGVADDGAYLIVQITGAATDNTSYYTFPVTVKAAGTLAAGQLLGADFSRVGDGGSVTSVDGNIGDVAVNNAKPVATRTALKALDTTKYTLAYLTEAGREGMFVWTSGNYSAQITSDTLEGVYVKATAIASSAGAWVRRFSGPALPQWFGAKADGIFASDGAITSGDQTFTSASAAFTSADIGKMIKVGRAGTGSQTLVTTIASINSATSVELTAAASTTASGANYTYGTDDTSAITAAKTYCLSVKTTMGRGGTPLGFPYGRYCYTDIGNLAHSYFGVLALEAGVWLESFRTSSGPAVTMNGLSYDATYGSYRAVFGGAHPFNIRGTSYCSAIFYYNNIHWAEINLGNLRDGNIGVLGDKSGNAGSPGAAVGTRFKGPFIGHHDIDSFDAVPQVAWYMTETYACNIEYAQLEVSGSSAPTFGLYMATSNGNVFVGGTVESCLYGGAWITSTCSRNTFIGMHNEFNGAGPDWQIDGHYTTLINCAGAGTYATLATSANIINGDYTQIIGGEFNDFEISSSADNTDVRGANLATGTISDNSTTSSFTGCNGIIDKAPNPQVSALTLASGFTSTGSPYKTAGYWRSRAGLMQVEGVVTCGTISGPTVVGTLPSGYRPSATVMYTGYNLTTEVCIALTINSSGQVSTRNAVATGNVIAITSPPFRGT